MGGQVQGEGSIKKINNLVQRRVERKARGNYNWRNQVQGGGFKCVTNAMKNQHKSYQKSTFYEGYYETG